MKKIVDSYQKGQAKPSVILVVFIGILLIGAGAYYYFVLRPAQTGTPQTVQVVPDPKDTTNQATDSNNPWGEFNNQAKETSPSKPVTYIGIYMIDVNNTRKSNDTIGCGDGVVRFATLKPRTDKVPEDIRTALTELFAVKEQNFSKGGLYNSLYQSTLKVDSVVTAGTTTTVKISGTQTMGGVCDEPRFAEQIKRTVSQFPLAGKTEIYTNNVLLK